MHATELQNFIRLLNLSNHNNYLIIRIGNEITTTRHTWYLASFMPSLVSSFIFTKHVYIYYDEEHSATWFRVCNYLDSVGVTHTSIKTDKE